MRPPFRIAIILFSFISICHLAFCIERQPLAAYHARRVALAGQLDGGVAVLFAGEEPVLDFMPYRQDADFYYLTGWNQPGAALLVEPAVPEENGKPGRPYREILFLPARNLRMEQYTGIKLDAATSGAAATAGVNEVAPMDRMTVILGEIAGADARFLNHFFTEMDTTQGASLAPWLATTLGRSEYPAPQDARAAVQNLRATKDPGEIALLHKASDASVKAQFAMMKSVHPGATELAVTGVIIDNLMKNGCERVSYSPIVGSGANSTVLHYSENSGTMKDGEVVVVDAAGEYSMYASDITRTMPVNGRFTTRQLEVYNVVLGAQKAAIDAFVAGKSRINDPYHKYPDSLDTIAWNYMNAHGKDLHGAGLGKYFIHGIGHSVGIDVHDPYDYSKPIEKGMVFTIEPGIYIPEERLGIRIEDVFYASPDGTLVDLTQALPKSAAEVEAAMRP